MRKAWLMLILAGLMAAGYGTFLSGDVRAAPLMPIASPLQPEPLWTPVRVWKDCQAIAMCTGCRPVYRCRSCTYKLTCRARQCSWGDVCVWGPYVKVLPRGARIIR
ncbi:MAG: hypothetical protein ACOYB4_11575 [Methyloceanibacter sp.]